MQPCWGRRSLAPSFGEAGFHICSSSDVIVPALRRGRTVLKLFSLQMAAAGKLESKTQPRDRQLFVLVASGSSVTPFSIA